MLSGRTHNGGFQERIICYILYKDDDYIAFLFRNKSILILILLNYIYRNPCRKFTERVRVSEKFKLIDL